MNTTKITRADLNENSRGNPESGERGRQMSATLRERIEAVLREHPNWSDRNIADKVGSSHPTVAKVRRALNLPRHKLRVGLDGRERFPPSVKGRGVQTPLAHVERDVAALVKSLTALREAWKVASRNGALRIEDRETVEDWLRDSMKQKVSPHRSLTESPAVGAATATGPEFLPAPGIRQMFGLSRSTLYRLHDEGRIKSVNLRRRGFASGRRLFAVDSIRELLRGEMAKQEKS